MAAKSTLQIRFQLIVLALVGTLVTAGCSGQSVSSSPEASGGGSETTDQWAGQIDYELGIPSGYNGAKMNASGMSAEQMCQVGWSAYSAKDKIAVPADWFKGCMDGFAQGVRDSGGGTSSGSTEPTVLDPKANYDAGYSEGEGKAWDPNAFDAKVACKSDYTQDNVDWMKGCLRGFADERKSSEWKAHLKSFYTEAFDVAYSNNPNYDGWAIEDACSDYYRSVKSLEEKEQMKGCLAGLKKYRTENPTE